MSEPSPRQLGRRSALTILAMVVVFSALLGGTVWQSRMDPPQNTIYLPATDSGDLGVVTLEEDPTKGTDRLLFALAGTEEPVSLEAGSTLMFDGMVLRIQRRGEGFRLEHVGALLDQGIVGGARDADTVLRLPGVGAHHVAIGPPELCGATLRCVESLVTHDHTRLERPGQGPALPLRQGEQVALEAGDLLWLGLSPLRVAEEDGLISLTLPRNYQETGGSRVWLQDPAPRWSLTGPGPWTLVSERALFKGSHLPHVRIARQWEEEVQQLVDEGVLCLVPGVPGSVQPPQVRWRDPLQDRCVDAGSVHPLTDKVQTLRNRYRYDRSLLRAIAQANDHLAEGTYLAAASLLHFTFDWQYVLTEQGLDTLRQTDRSNAQDGKAPEPVRLHTLRDEDPLLPVPTRLLGIWWGMSQQGVPRVSGDDEDRLRSSRMNGSPFTSLKMRDGSTSPQLRVVADWGGLRQDDLLLLTGSEEPIKVEVPHPSKPDKTVEGRLLGELCASPSTVSGSESATVLQRVESLATWGGVDRRQFARVRSGQRFHGTAFPLGRMGIGEGSGDRISLGPLEEAHPHCLLIAAGKEDSTLARIPGGPWKPLQSGDRLHWNGPDLVFRDTGDIAAITQPSSDDHRDRRVYPFETDAGQLIGRGGRHSSGLEAALTDQVVGEADRHEGIELSIHGDLQRIVHRALTQVMNRLTLDSQILKRSGRASAVLLDSNTGAILAAANWPPFDPNLSPDQEAQDVARRRLEGRTFDAAQNWAFTRNQAGGSTYKLATSIALARAGMLDVETTKKGTADLCSRGLRVYSWNDRGRLTPVTDPRRRDDQSEGHFRCLGSHSVVPTDQSTPRDTFIEAFARSCNVYFGMAGYALLDAGIPFGRRLNAQVNLRQRDLGLGEGPLVFSRGPGHPLGLVLPRSRSLGAALRLAIQGPGTETPAGSLSENQLWRTLLELGHRFQYESAQGTIRQQGDEDRWAPCAPYPTEASKRPWLPGVKAGVGFRYPEVPGPAAFAPDGWPASGSCQDLLEGIPGRVIPNRPARSIGLISWGQDVEASALSLAVMTGIPTSEDGRLAAPWIVASPDARDQPSSEALVTPEQKTLLRQAMRRVLQPGPGYAGTGAGDFSVLGERSSVITDRVGGKTGTITAVRPPDSANGATTSGVRRMRYYACGIPVADLDSGNTELPRLSPQDWAQFPELESHAPQPGFAAHTDACHSLTPGRIATDHDTRDEVAAALWQRRHRARIKKARYVHATSSAFVAGVFDPFRAVRASRRERALTTGEGLTLAVISDLHEVASKQANAMILSDLEIYYQIRGGAAPRSR